MKDFAVVVVNYNCFEETKELLRNLQQMNSDLFDVFLVDNNSTKESADEIRHALSENNHIHFFPLEQNIGFAGGCNVGITEAMKSSYRYVLLLNPDTLIDDKDFFTILKEEMDGVSADIGGPLINYFPDKQRIYFAGGFVSKLTALTTMRGKGEADGKKYSERCECDFITGAAMVIRSDVFQKIGLLPEEYFLYFEESDYCMRAKSAGLKVWFLPKAQLFHKVSRSIGYLSSVYLYYMIRNYRIFARKYLSLSARPFFWIFYLIIWIPGYVFLTIKQGNLKGIKYILRGFIGLKYE